MKRNYLQLLLVFVAFAFMVGAAYFFIGRIMRSHLLKGAQELLVSAEANVRAGLSESEATLLNSYYIVQGMIERGASREEILEYLVVTTEWMRRRDTGLLGLYGIYGFIHGEFYDGVGMNPGEDYIPQTRPWYQLAVRSGTNVAYTIPYVDWHTGDVIVSAVRNIEANGDTVGIIAVDININWLVEYVGSMALTDDGFGMLLSQNLTFMAYPDENFLGSQLQELGGPFSELARILRSGEEVVARRINDPGRGPVIVFIKHIFNNWFVGLVIPSSQFDHDLYTSAQILVLLGVLLSLALCFLLMRLSVAKQRSDEESKAKSSFLASMSHEIRTPLNAVIGLSEIVLNRGKLLPDSRSDIQQIHQSGTSLLALINDILDISKIEAGGLELIPAEYDTASFVNDTVTLNKVRIGSKPILFLLEISGDFPSRLRGDELRVRQVLNNILSNAIKYTNEGTVKLEVRSEKSLLPSPSYLITFIVSDTGIGIRHEDMGKLFSEYTQFDTISNRQIEGTGLGLAITRKIVEVMGGNISVESEYGKGSVFTVSLVQDIPHIGADGSLPPCIGEETAERLKQFQYKNPEKDKEIDRSWMPYGKVLVVDDLPVNLQVARGLLEPYGLSIDTAESGQEAIELIQGGGKYDLVFMDHMMPEMDGIEATRIIRAWEDNLSESERLPIVALTANALAGNMEMFLSKGFDGFIPKPIDLARLDEALNKFVRDRQSPEAKKNLVLLADANPANLRLGISALEAEYDVITAPSMEKMVRLLENLHPDVILMNASLATPDIKSGHPQVAEKDIPVITFPGPFEPAMLIASLENHFQGRQ